MSVLVEVVLFGGGARAGGRMACSLLLALTCVAAASAASYIDYGVKMPQYGGSADYESGRDPPPSQPSDDYHSNSPDAPASLDYKYEEEPRSKITFLTSF